MNTTKLLLYVILAVGFAAKPSQCGIVVEDFDDIMNLAGRGWIMKNNSTPLGTTGWFQANPAAAFPAHAGAADSYIAANYYNVDGFGTISDWLIMPALYFMNGDTLTFHTRTVADPSFPDRLQVRFSPNGASANVGSSSDSVGDFTLLLLDINSTLSTSSSTLDKYPVEWTQYTVQLDGLPGTVHGRLAFRYFVTDAGLNGQNGDYIGIDSVTLEAASIPEPTTWLLVAAGVTTILIRSRMLRRLR